MPTESKEVDIVALAFEASHNYYELYDNYPKIIYINVEWISKIKGGFITIPEIPTFKFKDAALNAEQLKGTKIMIYGMQNLSRDDVFLDMPELPRNGLRSGKALARMAKSEYDICK